MRNYELKDEKDLFAHIDDVDAFFDEWYEVYQEVRHSSNPAKDYFSNLFTWVDFKLKGNTEYSHMANSTNIEAKFLTKDDIISLEKKIQHICSSENSKASAIVLKFDVLKNDERVKEFDYEQLNMAA